MAYDGWIETTFVGSEIKNPGRNLPRAIILSTFIVIVFYVSVSVAFSFVLTPCGWAPRASLRRRSASHHGGAGAAIVAAPSCSPRSGRTMASFSPRHGSYAMARKDCFFAHRVGAPTLCDARRRAPHAGRHLDPAGTGGHYNQLATYVVFAQVLFYGLSATAVVKLRQSAPDLLRPTARGLSITPLSLRRAWSGCWPTLSSRHPKTQRSRRSDPARPAGYCTGKRGLPPPGTSL